MNSIYTIAEIFTKGYNIEVLDILSLIAILSGILVLISKNPIISVLFLIGLFSSISCYLILLGLDFIGLSYLIVYIGAVSILFLFILMLINIRISELHNNTKNSIPLAIGIILFLNSSIFPLLPYDIAILNNNYNYLNIFLYKDDKMKNNEIFFASSNAWDVNLAETSHISTIGNLLYTSHSLWLIMTSYILLLAMVGAIIITIKRK